jgi:uncharacterized protein YdeI (YjbR/CyaY-like superfamily)
MTTTRGRAFIADGARRSRRVTGPPTALARRSSAVGYLRGVSKADTYVRVHPRTRPAWRRWLSAHHASSPGIWLVLDKIDPRLAYPEARDEALCFGWVDSRPGKLDAASYKLLVTPRRRGSVWSKINKDRVEALIAGGLMMPSGLAKIAAAQRDGSWTTLDAIENLEMPAELVAALALDATAKANFDGFPRGVRKNILGWISAARRTETRAARVTETVRLAARGERANQWRPK